MRYTYHGGVEVKRRTWPWLVVLAMLVVSGGYVGILAVSPQIGALDANPNRVRTELAKSAAVSRHNTLYVPQLNLALMVGEQMTDGSAWQVGDSTPDDGGTYTIAAHRFSMGLTPLATWQKSPFYRLPTLKNGDQLYVDHAGTRYAYQVTRVFEATAIDVHSITDQDASMLLLYAAAASGTPDGQAIEARPIGTVSWESGTPRIKAF